MTGASVQSFLVDANNHTGYAQVLEEFSHSGGSPTLTKSYVIGDDVLTQCYGGAGSENDPKYLLYDGHGSTRQLLHTAATDLSAQYNYDAYGVSLPLTAVNNPETSLLYCGEQFDKDLEMYNLRARFYDPSNGRFNAMDTFGGSNGDPQTLHKYLYAHCDPVNGFDPSGLFTLTQTVMTVGILSILAGLYLGVRTGDRKNMLKGVLAGAAFTTGFAIAKLSGGLKKALWQGALGATVALAINLVFSKFFEPIPEPEITFDVFETFAWSFAGGAVADRFSGGDPGAELAITTFLEIGQALLECFFMVIAQPDHSKIAEEIKVLKAKIAFIVASMVVTGIISGALGNKAKLVWPAWAREKLGARSVKIAPYMWATFTTLSERIGEFLVDGIERFAEHERKRGAPIESYR